MKKGLKGQKTNVVKCRAVNGHYKGKTFEIQIGETSSETNILIDGKKPKQLITGIWIKMLPGEPTKITVEMLAK